MSRKYDEDVTGTFSLQPDPTTKRHYVGGMDFPLAAVGINNAILLETDDGSYQVIAGKRAAHLAHAGKWSLVGGYLEVGSSHGVMETIVKETVEETGGELFPVMPHDLNVVTTHMDYDDMHNGACLAVGNCIILRGKRAQQARDFIANGKGINSEVTELALFDLEPFEQQVEAQGGMAYPHELRTVQVAREEIQRGRDMQTVLESWGRQPAISKQWRPDMFSQSFVSVADADVTKTPAEMLELLRAKEAGPPAR